MQLVCDKGSIGVVRNGSDDLARLYIINDACHKLLPECSSDRQGFRECLVCLPKPQRLVCLFESARRCVCLSASFAKIHSVFALKGR
jgi:hypothetical protein